MEDKIKEYQMLQKGNIVYVKEQLKEVYEKDTIGMPMTGGNSKWKDDELKNIPILDVSLTAGGGMGGSFWHEYIYGVTLNDFCGSSKIMIVKTLNGDEIAINTKYIVKIEEFDLAYGIFHNENSNYEIGDWLYSYKVPKGTKVKTCSNYQHI